MRVFLDHCVPKRLSRLFNEHYVKTAYEMGWAAKKNRELVKLVENDFDVFLTVDRNLRHQQNLESISLKFIILVAADNQYDSLVPLVPLAKAALTTLAPGAVLEISGASH